MDYDVSSRVVHFIYLLESSLFYFILSYSYYF